MRCSEYDVVVLDIMMPGINGLDVLGYIRKNKSKVPVLMLSAMAEIEDRVAGLEAGLTIICRNPLRAGNSSRG